jgi:hypothetical protein
MNADERKTKVPRIDDATLRSVCGIIRRTEGLAVGEHSTFGDCLRAAALDLLDARGLQPDEPPAPATTVGG